MALRARFADDVGWMCEQLDVGTAVVVGHSLGGHVALELAAARPDLARAAVLIDSALLAGGGRESTVAGLVAGLRGRRGRISALRTAAGVAEQLPDTRAVRPRLAAIGRRNRRRRYDAPTRLRLQLLDDYRAQINALDDQERRVLAHLEELVGQSGSTLSGLCGLSTRSVAELLVEVGDPRRFTEGGFARFDGSAPLPASTAEGPGEPVRHRYNPGGDRRVNAILYRMAITQLRCEPRAQAIYDNARARGHTKKEARRILKRHLSDVIYRRMIRDLATADHASRAAQPLLAA